MSEKESKVKYNKEWESKCITRGKGCGGEGEGWRNKEDETCDG